MADPALSAKIKAAAKNAADSAGDAPDEATAEGIKRGEQEKKKARTSGVRADENEERLILTLTEEIDRLRTIYDENKRSLGRLAVVEAELAGLKSPHVLRKCLIAGCGLMGALGAAAISCYPQESEQQLMSLESPTVFGGGIAMIIFAAVFNFIFAIKA